MDNAVDILNNVSIKDEEYIYLWTQVVNTLQKIFEHDQDGMFLPFSIVEGEEANVVQISSKHLRNSTSSPILYYFNCPGHHT